MGEKKTEEAATAVLREVLAEDPAHPEGLMVLADLHERRGEMNRAVAIMSEALSSGEGAGTAAGRVALARRFGDLVKKIDPASAKKAYRQVLAAPFSDAGVRRSLQISLLDLLSGQDELAERAALSEEVLAGESGAEAATRAVELAEMRTRLHDAVGMRRALELGRSRCPDDADLFQRLTTYYTEHESWPELVELLSGEAARGEAGKAGSLLHQAARIQRDKLRDEAGAARSLRQAMESAPGDIETLRELTASLASSGDTAAAKSVVTDALADNDQEARAELLRLRAELAAAGGDEAAAVADMEEALSAGRRRMVEPLSQALARIAERATAAGDLAAARAATLRLAEVVRARATRPRQTRFSSAGSMPIPLTARFCRSCGRASRRKSAGKPLPACGRVWPRWKKARPWPRPCWPWPGRARRLVVALRSSHGCRRCCPAAGTRSGAGAPGAVASGGRQGNSRLRELHIQMADRETDEGERYRLLVRAAETLLGASAFPAAATALEKAAALRPTERAARTLLIDAYVGMGELARGAEALDGLLAEAKTMRAEELAALYQRQARLAAAKGDNEGRLQALKKALETDRKSVAIASEVADLAEAAGDDELAMRALRVVTANPVKDSKGSAVAYFRLGRIAHKSRDKARAIIFVKRALQEDPELAEAKALLDELK